MNSLTNTADRILYLLSDHDECKDDGCEICREVRQLRLSILPDEVKPERIKKRKVVKNPKWETWEDDYLREFYSKKDTHEVANELGRTYQSVRQRASKLKIKRNRVVYEFYKGSELIMIGNAKEIAVHENVSIKTVQTWSSNSYLKRLVGGQGKRVVRI